MFNGIVGHNDVKNELKDHLASDRLSHAYLFNGIAGIGKARMAKSFSKAILCGEGPQDCGHCRSCHVFDGGTHPDFLMVEAEKTIKVQAVKEMVEFVMTKPVMGSHKVILVNEAERMTIPAQNKLLKIFEEPPAYAVIILVINAMDSLIDTVISRGYAVDFRPLPPELIREHLDQSLGQDSRWEDISRFAQGSLSRALSNATDEGYAQVVDYPMAVFDAVIDQNTMRLVRLNQGFDSLQDRADELTEYLLTWLRDISILKKSRQSRLILYTHRRDALLRQSNYFSMTWIMQTIEAIETMRERVANHVNATVVFNHCLLKIQEAYDECSSRREI